MKANHPVCASLLAGAFFAIVLGACSRQADSAAAKTAPVSAYDNQPALQKIAQERNLTPDDLVAAAKTYMPSGRHDDFIMFASGGHSGQVFVIGIPSMRLLRSIAVFTPEPWQGWGYGGTGNTVLDEGRVNGKKITWADTHHPALSETNGSYDGQYLFINDKANGRVAVIDLRDFATKQIVKNPLAINDHGGAFVTPDTDWVIEGGQYATPLGWKYAPLSEYQKQYRGMVTFWKFDRARGRIDPAKSFAIELPPYWQDIADAGKRISDGWVFVNSFNTEMATGGIEDGKPPFEAGVSRNPMDYLHVINLRKAVEVAQNGQVERVNGFPVITLPTAIAQHLLYFVPEPKSPHGVVVAPRGDYIIVSGKLDPHVTIYSFAKIEAAIKAGKYEADPYGVPVLPYDACEEAQVEVGLGPLHTQFDNQGYAYTSLFLESAVARWTLGGAYAAKNGAKPWTLVDKIPIQYNVGHIVTVEGDTATPGGRFLVSLNKWSIDRFFPTGPLLPQNLQLIDISGKGAPMKLLYDMPLGVGEPHYAQIIRADRLKPWKVYPDVGWDPLTQTVDPNAPVAGKERIVRHGKEVEVFMTAVRSHYNPEHVVVNQGDHVTWHITNIERTQDATHGFALSGYNVSLSLEPGKEETFSFTADKSGTYTYYCTEFCSALHLEMMGYFLVKPEGDAGN